MLAWAAARSLAARTDAEGNVVVRVPASAERESAPVVVLQAHLDMVCERDPDSPFDPREGRIDVRVEDDWVQANGTTLGADNGIGVAAALAVADDDAVAARPARARCSRCPRSKASTERRRSTTRSSPGDCS